MENSNISTVRSIANWKKKTEQATTRVRQLAQIYNIYASASALPACLSQIFDTNFPQANLTMKPQTKITRAMKPKRPRKPKKTKKQDCKTHETKKKQKQKQKNKKNKIARPMKAAILEP